jgi:hypothetical protein
MKKEDEEFDTLMSVEGKKVINNSKSLEIATKSIESADKEIVTANATKNIYQKLSDFQESVEVIRKDKLNAYFKGSKYADINSVLEQVLPRLKDAGLLSVQKTDVSNNETYLITQIINIDKPSEMIESVMPLILKKDDSQGQGSALTYIRRYQLVTVLGLEQEDDDGNKASGNITNNAPQLITKAQYDEIANLITLKGFDIMAIAKANNLEGMHQLQSQNFQGFMNWLKGQ